MPPSDIERPAAPAGLRRWLERSGHPAARLSPLAGDVSARRYWRARGASQSSIVAVYPPHMRQVCERFRRTSRLLTGAGVRVPEILDCDCERGWMLLEDVGEDTLYDLARSGRTVEIASHVEQALDVAARIGRLPRQRVAALNPPLDRALLERELEQTWSSFLAPRGLAGDAATAARLRQSLGRLCSALGEAPAVPCHRDLMARNLIPTAGGELAVLDHQDLRLGPPRYDEASLLNDSLFLPAEQIAELLAGHRLEAPGELAAYRRAAAQRGLKAIGTFATFADRGNRRHLHLIPPTLDRALAHLLELPETAAAVAAVADRWRQVIRDGLLD